MGSQVHAVANYGDRILALERQMSGPLLQFKPILKRLEAADTLAFEGQGQTTLDQQPPFELLDFQIILKGLAQPDHLIAGVDVQLFDGQFALEAEVVRLQMAQIDEQRHKNPY
jgi:hypothetical protein